MAKHYINNRTFREQLILSHEAGELTTACVEMFIEIARRASYRLYYRNPDDRQDCIQNALFDMLRYWDRYDTSKDNPLAYFTQIAKNGYAKGWNQLYPDKYKGTISYNSGGEGGNDMYSI